MNKKQFRSFSKFKNKQRLHTQNDNFTKRNWRLLTQANTQTISKSKGKKTDSSIFPTKLNFVLSQDKGRKLSTGLKRLRGIQKQLYNLNETSIQNKQFRLSCRQKQSIMKTCRKQWKQFNPMEKALNLKPAQKMMLQFQREIRRIKRNQAINNKCDQVKENDRIQVCYATASYNSTQSQDCFKYGDGIHVLCDGHGSNGKEVANFVCTNIFEKCLDKKNKQKMDKNTLIQIFNSVDRQLQLSAVDISFSGTTCIALIVTQKQIIVANVGDCRAIIKKQLKIQKLSNIHAPYVETERQRIESVGGVVRQQQVGKGKFSGPLRIWAPGKNSWGPGITITRSFGDKAARRYGLISDPEVHSYQLIYDEQIIALGSKALFEYLKYEDIFNFIKNNSTGQFQSRQHACQLLAQQIIKKNQQQLQDISVILIFL